MVILTGEPALSFGSDDGSFSDEIDVDLSASFVSCVRWQIVKQ